MTLLAIDWSVVGIKAGQLILCLSILVVLHEMGHFLPAKWFKCRVEKFYLFFDPWFSLFKKKIGETVYGIGWLPLGGYVKISGMIDESMDKEQMKLPPKPDEFRSKPAWQRLIIMIGGVTVNLILGFFIFAMILWVWGEDYVPAENLKYGVYADSLGTKIGVKDGDRIIAVNGKKVERVGTVGTEIIINEAKQITIDRNGEQKVLDIPEGFIKQLIKNKLGGFTHVRFPLIIDSVLPAAKINNGNLLKGDRVINYNGTPITYSTDLPKAEIKNKTITLKLLRNDKDTVSADVYFNDKSETNVAFQSMNKVLGNRHIGYTFTESLPAGISKGWHTLVMNVKNFKLLFTSKEVKASDSLGSFLSIGSMFAPKWDWQIFWSMTALLSIILAFMNILPIPGLDGGHVVFTVYEMITGHKPSDKFMEYAQMVGMVILLSLMAYALGLDIFRLFK
ncbi:MAG: RIP metalloprotease RseP [Sphingobacteriales bacterium]|nr:RIP metalloprotease RseP [Sphingobacteriales bacterium]